MLNLFKHSTLIFRFFFAFGIVKNTSSQLGVSGTGRITMVEPLPTIQSLLARGVAGVEKMVGSE